MKRLSILGGSIFIIVVFGILNVDALGFSALYHQGGSEVLNAVLYVFSFVGLVALRRKLIK